MDKPTPERLAQQIRDYDELCIRSPKLDRERVLGRIVDQNMSVILDALTAAQQQQGQAVAEVVQEADGVNLRFVGPILPAGTKLCTAPPPSVPVRALPPSAVVWQPIETAPKDNKRPLYLAQFNHDTGELIELDWDAAWEAESESWEMPQVYYIWRSANGRVEEPTHWAYQDALPPADELEAALTAAQQPDHIVDATKMVAQQQQDESERMADAWGEFESEMLTDGNGYSPADTYAACHAAFEAKWPDAKAAHAAATAEFRRLHPDTAAQQQGQVVAWIEPVAGTIRKYTPEQYEANKDMLHKHGWRTLVYGDTAPPPSAPVVPDWITGDGLQGIKAEAHFLTQHKEEAVQRAGKRLLDRADKIIAALHQPPSAPVGVDEHSLRAARTAYFNCTGDVADAEGMNLALTAALRDIEANAQQPAASHCSDERPCVPCFSDCGPCEDVPAAVDGARPLDDWHEDEGPVVWWKLPVDEPAWIGTPLDSDWPGYHTHWTPHPAAPAQPGGSDNDR